MSFDKISIYIRNGQEYTFNYKSNLTMSEKIEFVNNVTAYIVQNNYYYIARFLFFDFEIIHMFTDYDISTIKYTDDSIGEIECLLAETNIVNIVKNDMVNGLLEDLYEAVNINIEYKTGIHKDTTKDAIASLINTIQDKIEKIDVEEFVKFAGLFSENAADFTPEKILDAYGKSNIFKKRSREIEKINKKK